MSLQADYGGFVPYFPGVSLEISSEEAWRFFDAGTRSQFNKDTWSKYESPAAQFESLSVQTAFVHEFRHFHDGLITPYNARAFGLRLRQIIHAYQLFANLEQYNFNCLPVPISRWCMLDDSERDLVIRRSGRHPRDGEWRLPKLPSVRQLLELKGKKRPKLGPAQDLESTAWLVWEAWKDQQRILQMAQRAPGKSYPYPHSWQIMELSALLAQLQQVLATSGEAAATFFQNYLRNLKDNPYGHILKVAYAPWRSSKSGADARVLAGMAMWSMCGSHAVDGVNSFPAYRFEALLHHLVEQPPPTAPENWVPVWNIWSRETGLSTVQEGVDDSSAHWKRSIEMAEEALQGALVHKDHFSVVTRATKAYAAGSTHMTDTFASYPNHYTEPVTYVQNMSHWSDPLIRYTFPLNRLLVSKDYPKLNGKDLTPHNYRDVGDNLELYSMVQQSEHSQWSTLTIPDALDLFNIVVLIELLFSDSSNLHRIDRSAALRQYFDEKVEPLKVFRSPSKAVLQALAI
jgi:hypothetical protein